MSDHLRKALEEIVKKLDWMLAPGATRREAIEIAKEALAKVNNE